MLSLSSAIIDNGNLILIMSDGTRINVGRAQGEQGLKGEKGDKGILEMVVQTLLI